MESEGLAKPDAFDPIADQIVAIPRGSRLGKAGWGSVVFALLFAMPGLALAAIYCHLLVSCYEAQSWQATPAKILRAELVSHPGRHGETYRTTAEYAYTFGGERHIGKRVCWGAGGDNIGSFQHDVYRELQSHRETGQPFRCFVNPADPSQAVLYRDLRPELMVVLCTAEVTVGGAFSLLLPLMAIGEFVRGRCGTIVLPTGRLLAHPHEPWLWRADWAAGKSIVSDRQTLIQLTVFAAAWNLFASPLWLFLPAAAHGNLWSLAGAGLIGIGLVLAALAVRGWRQRRRSVFRIDQIPATVERGLVGQIETTARPNAAGKFRLRLECVWIAENDKLQRERVLWTKTETVASNTFGQRLGHGDHRSVRFSIPPGAPGTNRSGDGEETQNRIVWRLILAADPPAAEPVGVFEVPIFHPIGDSTAATSVATGREAT